MKAIKLAYLLVLLFIWTIFRKFFHKIQHILWCFNGINTRIKDNYKAESYKGAVQVFKIWARHKFCVVDQPSGADNFMLTHHEFVDPEYVLQDHISLYYVTKDEGVFVEAEKGVDVTASKNSPFVRCAQFHCAKKVIVMPIKVFHRLGEQVGKTNARIIFICNTARCGSTLMTQVFEETGSAVTYSEPDAFNALTQLKGVVSETERKKVVQNCFNLLCKPVHYKEVKSYVLKIFGPCMVEMPYILQLFPDSHAIFMYRDGLKCSISLSKISKEVPILGLMMLLGKLSGKFTKKTIEQMGVPADLYEIKLQSGIHFGAMAWCVSMKQYLEFRESGLRIAGVRYEDLLEDTTYAYEKVFEFCDLPFDAKAVEVAMSRDSQRGTEISIENLAKYKVEQFTKETKKHTDMMCDQVGLPHFPETYIAPGTISYREQREDTKM